tara:strand:+ start:1026 stop:2033 length:1008 start_codon:yes stop_codon:yes gene_type:complete
MQQFKIGIVGLGPLSQTIHLPCFNDDKNFKIKALCDHNLHLLKPISLKYGITKIYTNIDLMIKKEKLDAIICIVQRPNTFQVSKKILSSNINLLSEKPISLKSFEAKRLVKIQRKNKLKFGISYMKRSDDAVQHLKKIHNKKIFGKIISVNYNSFVGKVKPITKNFIQHKSNLRKKKYSLNKKLIKKKEIFEKYLNTHCHSVNLIKFIFGNISIKKVNLSKLGEGSVFFENKKNINIVLKNKYLMDNVLKEFIYIKYSEGYIKLILQNPFKKKDYSQIIIKMKNKKTKILKFKNWCFQNQTSNFANYLKKKKSVLSTAQDGLQDIEIIEKIFKMS